MAASPAVERIMKEYKGKVRLVVKFLPYKYRDFAFVSAEAALAAHEQGKFYEMHHLLLKRSPQLDRPSLLRYAQELGLDTGKFQQALDTKKHAAHVNRDLKLGTDLDLYNTPSFFINGRRVVGNVPYEYLKKIVTDELKR
ncbi:MAG TPA: thioredoxin domain-containing protein [Dissulfurispiraceae bacterium]|nr:thioredoxin domain-containing protein [Dissulfurispiraceae bacterium]